MKKWSFVFLILLVQSSLGWAHSIPKIVVSFSILKDLVENVGGEAVTVTSLVGPNSDAHVFEPTPESAQLISEADLILMNGLGFEGWMPRLVESTKTKAKIVMVSQNIKPRAFMQGVESSPDPHAWNDVQNVMIYIDNIEKALLELIPQSADQIWKHGFIKSLKVYLFSKEL